MGSPDAGDAQLITRRSLLFAGAAAAGTLALSGCSRNSVDEGYVPLRSRGYPAWPSVFPGDNLTLHVATPAKMLQARFYRLGNGMRFMGSGPWWKGTPDTGDTTTWTPREFTIPTDWPTGAYVALLVEGDSSRNVTALPSSINADGRYNRVLFVVRNPHPGSRSKILYPLAFATYSAYNATPSAVHPYPGYGVLPTPTSANLLTLRRPGGGTGGITPYYPPYSAQHSFHGQSAELTVGGMSLRGPYYWDDDLYDPYMPVAKYPSTLRPGSLRNTVAQWDGRFIAWLERNGYSPDFCADFDIEPTETNRDAGLQLLQHYRLILSVGHDEYFTEGRRSSLQRFIARGGNAAFFSGNVCHKHMTLDAVRMTLSNDGPWNYTATDPAAGPGFSWYNPDTNTDEPGDESSLVGTASRNGGEHHWDNQPPHPTTYPDIGYRVQNANHWVFSGMGVSDGDVIGKGRKGQRKIGLVGYECDGALYDMVGGVAIARTVSGGPNSQLTPDGFIILGLGELSRDWKSWPREAQFAGMNHAATMGLYTRGGTVFTGGTIAWPRVVDQGFDARVEQVTRNVLNRLSH